MDELRYRAAEQALLDHHHLPVTERWVTFGTGGPRLRVLEAGDPSGPPVVFVHGAMVAGASWVDLASMLRDHRCLLLDRPGCALSEPIVPTPSLRDLVGVADALVPSVLDGLGIERAHLVGTSMGGYFVLRAAAAAPTRVRTLTVLGWSLGAPVSALPLLMRLATHRWLARVAMLVPASRGSVRAMLRATGLADAVDSGRLSPVGIDWNVAVQNHTDTRRHELRIGGGAGLREQMDALVIPADVLARIAAPTRVVFGTGDPFGTVATMQALVDAIPDGALEVWDGAGHAVWLDDVDRAAAALRTALALG